MRILHLDTGRELRGGQRQLLLLARGLAQLGHDQVILCRCEAALYAERDAFPLTLRNLARESRRADVIHAHDARAHTLAALAGPGRKLVVSRRVVFPVRAGVLSRWKYRRAARFLAISQFVKARLLEVGINEDRISVVFDGVDVTDRGAAGERGPHVLAPATGDPQKGSALAAESCRLAGAELKFSTNLEADLPQAAAFLYLSHSEGLGSAILLAMAHRTPVVASRVGGIPEIIEHGCTGLLVENTPEAVAGALRDVMADPSAAIARAEAAHAQILARFTDVIMVAQTERAYRLALGIS